MKKILAILLCIVLICTLSVTVFAEETTPEDTPEDIPSQEEIEAEADKIANNIVDDIVAWVQNHLEEISVIVTLLLTIFYNVRKFATMNKSIGTLNNNAITVAKDSSEAVGSALVGVEGVKSIVATYVNEFADLKGTIKASLEQTEKRYETAKLANIELANEVAELLVLANIPPSKKEELYARHRAALDKIAEAEKPTEVIGYVKEA
jgi:hypothetical protein